MSEPVSEATALSGVSAPDWSRAWRRRLSLVAVCSGVLMIGLDTTIINVALQMMRNTLHFLESSLVWVVNAYLIMYGGVLLAGGRLGDFYGARPLFSWLYSRLPRWACACVRSAVADRRARGARVGPLESSGALALLAQLYAVASARARALGLYSFVCAGGGTFGLLLGGLVASTFGWHWLFLVNVPISVLVFILSAVVLSRQSQPANAQRPDLRGAILRAGASMIAVHAVVQAGVAGWTSAGTLIRLGLAVGLIAWILLPAGVAERRLFREAYSAAAVSESAV